MKRRDQGKATLVDFLRSIKFAQQKTVSVGSDCATHFAVFEPQARPGRQYSAEDSQLIRSAN